MLRNLFLIVVALVLLLTGGQNLFAQFDPPLELQWEVQNIGEYNEQFAVAPDETIFVATHQQDSTATIRVYDMTNGTLLRQFPAPFCWKHIVFMSDSRHLAITGATCPSDPNKKSGKIKIMDIHNGIITDSLDFPDSLKNEIANDITVSPNGKYLSICISLYGTYNNTYVIYNTNDWSMVARLFLKNASPYISAFSPDSKYFFFNEYNKIFDESCFFKMLNLESKEIKTIHKADNNITDIKFSKDSTKMLFARNKNLIGIYDIKKSMLDTFKLSMPFINLGWIEMLRNNLILNVTNSGISILNTDNQINNILSKERGGYLKLLKDNISLFYLHYRWAGVVTGLDKISSVNIEENNELLYPNPSTNILTLPINGLVTPNQIQIFDLKGQIVNLSLDKILILNNEIQINVSNLENGTYFLTVQNGNKQNTYKFIVGR